MHAAIFNERNGDHTVGEILFGLQSILSFERYIVIHNETYSPRLLRSLLTEVPTKKKKYVEN